MPETRSTSVRMTSGGNDAHQTRHALAGKHRFHLVRRPRQYHHHRSALFYPLAGRGAAVVGKNMRALDHHSLPLVDLRHGAKHLAKALFNGAADLGVEDLAAVERKGHGVARDVVLGRSEAA